MRIPKAKGISYLKEFTTMTCLTDLLLDHGISLDVRDALKIV